MILSLTPSSLLTSQLLILEVSTANFDMSTSASETTDSDSRMLRADYLKAQAQESYLKEKSDRLNSKLFNFVIVGSVLTEAHATFRNLHNLPFTTHTNINHTLLAPAEHRISSKDLPSTYQCNRLEYDLSAK